MRRVDWLDEAGRWRTSEIPDAAPDDEAAIGVPVGPPDLTPLGLPEEHEVRLHNQLFHRGLLTNRDARRRVRDVQSAIHAAFKTDVHAVLAIYEQQEADDPGDH